MDWPGRCSQNWLLNQSSFACSLPAMRTIPTLFAACILASALGSTAPAPSSEDAHTPAQAGANVIGSHGFDFLFGEWRVHHRRLKADTHKWGEFDGTCRVRPLLDGSANLEEQVLNSPTGTYRAVGLRSYDAKTAQWSIRWLDGRYPSYPLDPPVKGGFENGVGTFYSDYMDNGKPMRVRFLWSHITSTTARWEQATSADAGKTWDTNWIMEFQRVSAQSSRHVAKLTQADAGLTGSHAFDFLVGDWRVRHRYFRVATRDWKDVDGTCDNRPLMDGWANVEEHMINAPGGAYRAIGLRAYDPKSQQWLIWWLDGRDPSGGMDPPVKGQFENGIGTFVGDIMLNGKPVRVRFIWSQITPTSARWEQAYSADAGKTWETNWTMNFQRTS